MADDSGLPSSVASTQAAFVSAYLQSVRAFRGVLIQAFGALGIDSARPREAARQLGLDKSLVWKLTRVVHEDEPFRIAGFMPGASGMGMVTRAMEASGVNQETLATIMQAYQRYLEMIELHAGDRETLEHMLYGMIGGGDERFRKSRQSAYKGNCGIWGVQSATRVSTHFLAINKDNPGTIDHAQLVGLLGFQRLRPGPAWPIFQFHSYEDTGGELSASLQAIEDEPDPAFPFYMKGSSTGQLPEMIRSTDPGSISYEFGDGPIGKTGMCDAYFGYIDTQPKPRYQDEHNRLGELLCIVNTPIQTLVFDLIVERELGEQIKPESLIYGRATGPRLGHELRDQRTLVPYTDSLQRLEPGAHMLTTPHAPSYNAVGEKVMKRMGRSFEDFVCWRLVMQYPVMHSTVAIKFDLPEG